jgi:predicted MFS family arabinose efflux permease
MEIVFSDPSLPGYYYPIIFAFLTILFILNMVKSYLKNNTEDGMNISLENKTNPTGLSLNNGFILDKNQLKIKYLIVYILARIAMWSKAPYIYALFSTYYKFSISEIGRLYLIDSISALISGPLTGGLADKYGRKLFCQVFNLLVIVNMLFRISDNIYLVYFAQVITGICSGLLNTTFESWLVSSTNKTFNDYPEYKARFLKKIIKTQNILDAILSIVISAVCALFYVNFNKILLI